jgi:hypothetical protein
MNGVGVGGGVGVGAGAEELGMLSGVLVLFDEEMSTQAMGSKPVWLLKSSVDEALWTFTYQPVSGIEETLLITVVEVPKPTESA